jgi:hypothetical protein
MVYDVYWLRLYIILSFVFCFFRALFYTISLGSVALFWLVFACLVCALLLVDIPSILEMY